MLNQSLQILLKCEYNVRKTTNKSNTNIFLPEGFYLNLHQLLYVDLNRGAL